MNKKSFTLNSQSLKIKEALSKDFLEIEIYAISEGKNRNKTSFTLNSMEKAIPTFFNKFILGYFRINGFLSQEGEFEEHNSDLKYDPELDEEYWSFAKADSEKALGIIRESDTVEIVDYKGKKWIKLTAAILTKYNREAVKHLLKGHGKKKISVEITVLESHEEDGIEIIDEFVLDGITIIANHRNTKIPCREGIENAHMKLKQFISSEDFSEQKQALVFAYKELDEQKTTPSLSENEEVEEIVMVENNEEAIREGKTMLTYEQKRQLLEEALRAQLCSVNEEGSECECCVWVVDLDDNKVYFYYDGSNYVTSYAIEEVEGEIQATVNLEDKQKVIRDWKIYVEEENTEVQESEEITEETIIEDSPIQETYIEQNDDSDSEDEKDKPSEDEDDKDDVDDKDEKDNEVENQNYVQEEESTTEESQETVETTVVETVEEVQEETQVEEPVQEEQQYTEDQTETVEPTTEVLDEEIQEEAQVEESQVEEPVQTSEKTYEFEGKTYTLEELGEHCLAMAEEIKTLKEERDTLQFNLEVEMCQNAYNYGLKLLMAEELLSCDADGDFMNKVKSDLAEGRDSKTFNTKEAVETFVNNEIKDYIYKRSKAHATADNRQEFSSRILTDQEEETFTPAVKDSYQEMNDALSKINY